MVRAAELISGRTTSCGCAQREKVRSLYVDGTAPCKLTESSNPRGTNTSGVTGVWWDKSRKKWTAELMLQGKKHFLGRYDCKEDAIAAREAGALKYFSPHLENEKPDTTAR